MAGVMRDREQHQRRRTVKKHDQFGRTYAAIIDIEDAEMGHCAPLTLTGKYRPPIDIPAKYFKKRDPDDPFMVPINFAQWKADLAEANRRYEQRLRGLAEQMFPSNFGDMIDNPPPVLMQAMGPMPIPLEFVEACEVGNKWALGIPKPDGTFYPRPKWATEDLMERYRALKQSYWHADEGARFAPPDPAKYADEEDDVVGAGEIFWSQSVERDLQLETDDEDEDEDSDVFGGEEEDADEDEQEESGDDENGDEPEIEPEPVPVPVQRRRKR